MGERGLLGANIDSVDALFVGQQSLFSKKPMFKMAPNQRVYKDVKPAQSGTISPGDEVVFNPQRAAAILGELTLISTMGAASSTGATAGSYPAYVDAVGFHILSKCKIIHGVNDIQEFTGFQAFLAHQFNFRSDKSLEDAFDGGLQADLAQRATNAATASYEVISPLSHIACWASKKNNWLPYDRALLRSTLRIEITYAQEHQYLVTDGSDLSQSITQTRLRTTYVHVDPAQVARMAAEVRSGGNDLGQNGWSRPVVTWQTVTPSETLAGSTAEQEYKMTNLIYPTKAIHAFYRATEDIPTASESLPNTGFNPAEFQEISQDKYSVSDIEVQPEWTKKYKQYIHSNAHWPADMTSNVMSLALGYLPSSESNYGYLNHGTVDSPLYTFTLSASNAGKMGAQAQIQNVLNLDQSQDLSILFYTK